MKFSYLWAGDTNKEQVVIYKTHRCDYKLWQVFWTGPTGCPGRDGLQGSFLEGQLVEGVPERPMFRLSSEGWEGEGREERSTYGDLVAERAWHALEKGKGHVARVERGKRAPANTCKAPTLCRTVSGHTMSVCSSSPMPVPGGGAGTGYRLLGTVHTSQLLVAWNIKHKLSACYFRCFKTDPT